MTCSKPLWRVIEYNLFFKLVNSHPNKFRDVLHFASKTQSISSYSFVLINIYALIYRIYRKDVIHYILLYHPYLYYIHIYTKDMMSGKLVQNAKKNTHILCVVKSVHMYILYTYIFQGGKSLCFLGLISTYQEQFGQQQIELGSSFYVASAGWSNFTPF